MPTRNRRTIARSQRQLSIKQRLKAHSRTFLAGGVAAAAFAVLGLMPAAASAKPSAAVARCRSVAVTVTVPPLDSAATISGTLCQPTHRGPNARTLQLLLHGGTYNRSYWDFPYDPTRYSYVRAANAAGFSTLAIDRLGYGKSTHPFSGLVTVQSDAATVHQVITAVRAGKLGASFTQIILVGHSIGSAVTIQEAGTYHDVNAVVVTGLLHHLGAGVPTVLSSVEPAFLDPTFSPLDLDPGYVVTRPGTRGKDFYYLPNADPYVIAVDHANEDVFPSEEAIGFIGEVTKPPGMWKADEITVPTLVVVGEYDTINCGPGLTCQNQAAVLRNEQQAYTRAPSLQVTVMPNMGHDLNTQLTSPTFFALANRWIAAH